MTSSSTGLPNRTNNASFLCAPNGTGYAPRRHRTLNQLDIFTSRGLTSRRFPHAMQLGNTGWIKWLDAKAHNFSKHAKIPITKQQRNDEGRIENQKCSRKNNYARRDLTVSIPDPHKHSQRNNSNRNRSGYHTNSQQAHAKQAHRHKVNFGVGEQCHQRQEPTPHDNCRVTIQRTAHLDHETGQPNENIDRTQHKHALKEPDKDHFA